MLLRRRLPTLTIEQRDILAGIAVRAAAETVAALAALACVVVVVWVVVSVIVGSIEVGRWIGGVV